MTVRLGLFGGTFDPPHVGHLVAAVNVRHALALDRVDLVVANEPWQKVGTRPLSPAADRLAMVEAAVRGVDGVEASSVEVDRGGPSYTADTVTDLAAPGFDLFVVLGRDAALGIDTWERVDEVVGQASLVVVDRPGTDGEPLPSGYEWHRVEAPLLQVSSTDLRARVSDGRPLDFLLPRSVVDCITERRLYPADA